MIFRVFFKFHVHKNEHIQSMLMDGGDRFLRNNRYTGSIFYTTIYRARVTMKICANTCKV